MSRFNARLTMREPIRILILALLASGLFALTHAYTRAYDNRRSQLGAQWFARGVADLQARQSNAAVEAFRTALSYAPDNWDYRLQLAKALMVANRITEALGYYQSLWQVNPTDGSVNLQLARLAVQAGDREGAERYFNGAIFGVWQADPQANRRETLFEMIDFYLKQKDYGAADSQLMVLSSNLPSDSGLQIRVAELFLAAGDNMHAEEHFRDALSHDRDDPEALAGAAQAAFRLGEYSNARSDLERLLRLRPADDQARGQLELIKNLLSLDPFAPRIGSLEKARRIVRSFRLAGERMNDCAAQLHVDLSQPGDLHDIAESWNSLSPQVSERTIADDDELAERTIDLAFQIEKQTNKVCGPPSGQDQALFLIAQRRSGDSQ